MTTPLEARIRRLIASGGPIPVADYFDLCANDPCHGAYRMRDPFGARGDFITAPEISQMFGELVGVFLVMAWQAFGRPKRVRLVEIGPGRGALMADLQRAIDRLAPDLADAATACLVEPSDRLAAIQKHALGATGWTNFWYTALDGVSDGFTLLVANELFDAIPVRQLVATPEGFRERVVKTGGDGRLEFGLAAETVDAATVAIAAGTGEIVEIAPARETLMAGIADRLAHCGGVALVIDYGHLASGAGDTLQALRRHCPVDVLDGPGTADLTSHVDFAALARAAAARGAHVWPAMTQGTFLARLGLAHRARALARGKPQAVRDEIAGAADRLGGGGGPDAMGRLFKVLCVAGDATPLPVFGGN